MPINYVAPSPVANSATMSGFLDRPRQLAGGGGGGYGGMGQIVQLHDPTGEYQSRMDLAALHGVNEANLLTSRGEQARGLQEQAASLDAWQFNQKVTAQEAAQLRADQRSISAVDADPTMSDAEKVQAKTRIKSRIDWVDERQKRDLQKAQIEQAQQHAALFKSQVQMEEQRSLYQAASIGGKLQFQANDQLVTQAGVKTQVKDEMPFVAESDPAFQARLNELAREKGLGYYYTTDKDGKPVLDKSSELASHAAGHGVAAGTGSGDRSVTKSMSEDQLARHSETINKAMDTWEKGREKPPTPEERDAKLKQVIAEQKQIHDALVGRTPEEQNRQAVAKQREGDVGIINAIESKIMQRPDLSDNQKTAAAFATRKLKYLYNTYGPVGIMPPAIKKQVDEAQSVLDQLDRSNPPPKLDSVAEARIRKMGELRFQIDPRSRLQKFQEGDLVTGQDLRDAFGGIGSEFGPPSGRK